MNGPIETLAGRAAGIGERKAAISVAALLVVLTIAVAPFARMQLPMFTAFLPMWGMLATSSDLLTAFLLLSQARVARSKPLVALATAYALSGMAIATHIAVFPGVIVAAGMFGARSQTIMWVWVLWHSGFPLCIAVYAAIADRIPPVKPIEVSARLVFTMLGGVLSTVALATVLFTQYEQYLPLLVRSRSPGLLGSSHVGYVVVGLIVVGLTMLVFFTRLRNVVDLWLAVALVSSGLDTGLSMISSDRFTVGWYVSRLMSLSTSMVVLIAFLLALGALFMRLARMSCMDGLTGLSNRRAFDDALLAQVSLARRTGNSISVLMLDVDHFKKYNDTYGHPAGDVALREVARAVGNVVGRMSDFAARYGGEEFVAILPGTNAEGARRVGERIGNHVRHLAMEHSQSDYGIVTVSVGVSTLSAATNLSNFTTSELLRRADDALYRAKAAGRDRTVVYRDGVADNAPVLNSTGASTVEVIDLDEDEFAIEFDLPELQPHVA
jgi:diguanylate cyclase (GGDEF)-like protein